MRHKKVILMSALLMLFGKPAFSAVTNAYLSSYLIANETVGWSTTGITYEIDEISRVVISIHRLHDVSEIPGAENLVEEIDQNGVAIGSHTINWDGLWLLGNDIGRQNGNFQVIVTADGAGGETRFVITTLLQITSVDIHDVNVFTSTDAASNPTLPYFVVYNLAKDSLVTVKIFDSSSNLVRTLATDAPQFGENIKTNFLVWNGLDNNNKPTPLGIYTVTIDAKDPSTADVAIQRTRTVAITSLARYGESLNELFAANAIVYPNPIRDGRATFAMIAMRNNANLSLKIYTLTGDLVRKEEFINVATGNEVTFNWNADNESGKKLGRGLYYFVARQEDAEGVLQAVKKLAIIR